MQRDSKNLSWHRARFFPINNGEDDNFKHIAVIGIGGNKGDVKKTFVKLYRYFMGERRLHIVKTSVLLQNPPFGYLDQADFLNAVMIVQTSMSAQKLLRYLQHTENIFKRSRSFKNAPRTLDLDIIFFDTAKIMQKNLIIPHPYWQERLSVLLPLSTM